MNIYVIRHGETDWNKAGRIQGQSDIPLNSYGIELAQITSEALKEVPFEIVFCSPLIRARQTARILVGDRRVPIIEDDRLKEISFGVREGAYLREIRENEKDPIHNFFMAPGRYCPPQGAESFEELARRSGAFMREVLAPLEGKYSTVLIVAHGALNHSIVNSVANIPVEDYWRINMKNCAVSKLSLENGAFALTEESRIYY